MIELKLALDRWCKPDSLPSATNSPARSSHHNGSSGGGGGSSGVGGSSGGGGSGGGNMFMNRSKSLNSSRLFSFLGGTSSGNGSSHSSSGVGGDGGGVSAATNVSANTSVHSNVALDGVGVGATVRAGGAVGVKRPSLYKITEEPGSTVTGSGVSGRPSLGSRSRSSDAVVGAASSPGRGSIPGTRPSQANTTSSSSSPTAAADGTSDATAVTACSSTSTGASPKRNLLHLAAIDTTLPPEAAAHSAPTPPPAPARAHPVISSAGVSAGGVDGGAITSSCTSTSNSNSASSNRKAGLRAKERTWVYHAVMEVAQSIQQERGVPVVVFL